METDYDAVKHFRQEVEDAERQLKLDTQGRVSVESITIRHNWELWKDFKEED